jgi:hypothetical protein
VIFRSVSRNKGIQKIARHQILFGVITVLDDEGNLGLAVIS